MTDESKPADAATSPDATPDSFVAVASDETGAYYVVVAQFPDMDATTAAYEDLRELERTTSLKVDGVVIASCDADGKVHVAKATDHSTKRGLKWGVAGGIALGVLFPPSILAGAIGAGGIGAAIGKIRSHGHRNDISEDLASVMKPNTSGIIALVEDTAVVEVEKALATADAIVSRAVDKQAAAEIDREAEAAKEAL